MYTLLYKRNQSKRNLEVRFLVKYNGFFYLIISSTIENNKKFKELFVVSLDEGPFKIKSALCTYRP